MGIHVDAPQPNIQCSVYQKPTNSGIYLNYNSECPKRYKYETINALIHRTYKISSTWQLLHTHISNLQQAFINNGYPIHQFEKILNQYLTKLHQNHHTLESQDKHARQYLLCRTPTLTHLIMSNAPTLPTKSNLSPISVVTQSPP